MTNKPFNIFLIGLLFFLTQLLFLNDLNFRGLFLPQIFPIFFLLFPRNFNWILLMILGFLYSFLLELFLSNIGASIVASVFICFLKPFILKLLYNRNEEEMPYLSLEIQGVKFIFRYLLFSLIIYHFVFFLVELGSFYNLLYVVLKSIFSSLLAVILYFVFKFLFSTQKSKKDIKLGL